MPVLGRVWPVQLTSEDRFTEFCDKLMALDRSIAFVGLADETGNLVAMSYVPFVDEKKAEEYGIKSALSGIILEQFEPQAGKMKYSMTFHEKTTRVTLPVFVGNRRVFVLMIMNMTPEIISILENKVLPFISSAKELL